MFALVQVEDFDQGELYARLKHSADEKASGNTGAIVTFTGLVRDFNNAG
ncbi:MAG: molybdopterin synthase catalytic subunit, partial [Pseudomonadota bacterium]|nr:molybdopterin synthase catalytic subunit [Pseudomonadota bacterium]